MSNSKKNKNNKYKNNYNNQYSKNNHNLKKSKKVLDGVDLSNNKTSDKNDLKINNNKKFNINNYVQNIVSILLTIIIFIAFIMIILVLYNNYFKKETKDNNKCDVKEVCSMYIKEDYKITSDDVKNFLYEIRGVIYNIDSFDNNNILNEDYLNFALYFIWNNNSEYLLCSDDLEDSNCLITKKEVSKNDLNSYFLKYLNISNPIITFDNNFSLNDEIRLYEYNEKIVLSFDEFEYTSFKHDIVDITIDSSLINVIFVLSKKLDNDNYSYVGYKKVKLEYLNNNFIIKKIETIYN